MLHHHWNIQPGKVYLIDFGSSQQFDAGPGQYPAVELGLAQYKPPLGMHAFDPFSWDVMCSGMLLRNLAKQVKHLEILQTFFLRGYARWLIGEEGGCLTVCHCRPAQVERSKF